MKPFMLLDTMLTRCSFFGSQSGDFSLSIRSIVALKETPTEGNSFLDASALEKGSVTVSEVANQGQVRGNSAPIHVSATPFSLLRIACTEHSSRPHWTDVVGSLTSCLGPSA